MPKLSPVQAPPGASPEQVSVLLRSGLPAEPDPGAPGNAVVVGGWLYHYSRGRTGARVLHQLSVSVPASAPTSGPPWRYMGAVMSEIGMPPIADPEVFFQYTDVRTAGPGDRLTWRWFSDPT